MSMLRIALIAHDKKKDNIVELASEFKDILTNHKLYATGTTGSRIIEATGLDVHRFRSGPLGGDQQIGAAISNNEMDLVIFLRDPLTPQAHEPDISALLRLCDVYEIPLATNDSSARIMIEAVDKGIINWREGEHGDDWKRIEI
ncbi:methylglyoxal synthase [Aerococcaceae bacterium DSM 111176]|nr:methylglyoxal synthase [Aerococcaceae bacterium DSM 111176]